MDLDQAVGSPSPDAGRAHDASVPANSSVAWYCPSRWLMAHHDPLADISTLASHICLADLIGDGENLLCLVDFKQQQPDSSGTTVAAIPSHAPYGSRLRIYRGQQLIYNHFLDDLPACLIATGARQPVKESQQENSSNHVRTSSRGQQDRVLLTMAINDDVYFYHKLRPSHKLSLYDDLGILGSINKSELEAWQMVKQNQADFSSMRDLLSSLSNELGPNELTSHSINFLALRTDQERKNYLASWKFKKLQDGDGEHLMSMDIICCAAAKLKCTSNITRSGDFGRTRDSSGAISNKIWESRVHDVQRDGLVVGTEDRHLLIYELRANRAHLEYHHRLQATPEHILVERCLPSTINTKIDPKLLSYKIIVACRDCCIYVLDQPYLPEVSCRAFLKQLLSLKANVVDMSWSGDYKNFLIDEPSHPYFVVACSDRCVYCFASDNGVCRWLVELETAITCIVTLPIPRTNPNNSGYLVGVASQENRVDFYMSHSGRIVDSIYMADDHCKAMTFGRFGREDNCLVMVSNAGHLMIFILKRTAKFAHGQCLSSAASHASHALSTCSESPGVLSDMNQDNETATTRKLKLSDSPTLPTAFSLSKSSTLGQTIDKTTDRGQGDHNCDQVGSMASLDAHLAQPTLQVPMKDRNFVDQIVKQSRSSTAWKV